MTASHLYVYCAVRGPITDRALKGLPSLPNAGPPRAISLDDDISIVVADVPAKTYGTEPIESRLSDLNWMAQCGVAHHAVPDALVDKFAVVPFRLFTLFSSETRARGMLGRRRAALLKALDRLEGRAEWVLRIGPPDPARARHAPAAAARSAKSGTSFLRAKAEQRRTESQRAERVAADAVTVFETLKALAEDSVSRPVAQGTNLLLDAAFLIGNKREAMFKKALAKAAAGLLDQGCSVTLTGPWPAYSFVSLK